MPEKPDTIPSLAEFERWSPTDVSRLTEGKTVVFAPGGTSRWYFLEHGDPSQGYARGEQFADYARMSLRRIVEIVDMMCSDGISTVFVVAHMPGQDTRDKAYNENLGLKVGKLLPTARLLRISMSCVRNEDVLIQVVASSHPESAAFGVQTNYQRDGEARMNRAISLKSYA